MGGAYEVTGSAVKKYYSIAGMMVAVNDGTGLQYLLTDHLGSVVATTNASGTLTSQQRYLPFGEARSIPNSPILATDFGYTGQRLLDSGMGGIMDYKARFYSPYLNQFTQPDTIIPSPAIPQTWNRYSYAINNPTKFTDPSGHFIETLFDVAMIIVDVADIAKNGLNVSNGAALVLDVAAVIIPGVPAVAGLTIKAAKAANAVDNAMDAAKLVNKVDNVADTAKALKNGAEELGSCLVNSFKADTDVETSEGPKDISAIQIGDYVLAWDESSGTVGYYEVTNAFHHTDAVVTEVILGGEWIETTPEHPFYVEDKGWVEAEDLKIGDEVRQADGTTGRVWLKWNVYKTQEMYNLTVDTAHTFFVGEGQWLVHNTCPIIGKPQTSTTLEHQIKNWEIAVDYANSGRYDVVFINKEVKKATKNNVFALTQPDVMGLNFDQKIADIVEIVSPSQLPGKSAYQQFITSVNKTTRAFLKAGWDVTVKMVVPE
jgi:RHS repeat-associated protein